MEALKEKTMNPELAEMKDAEKFARIYAGIPDKEKPRAIAIISAFMDGMEAQRLLNEEAV